MRIVCGKTQVGVASAEGVLAELRELYHVSPAIAPGRGGIEKRKEEGKNGGEGGREGRDSELLFPKRKITFTSAATFFGRSNTTA